MSESVSVQVNFAKPVGLFPLESVTLLPHQVAVLHVFEPRYRQMVGAALDGSGQIAMAVFAGDGWKRNYHGRPKLRRAVCLGQIMQHEALSDGRYNVLLQGVCRARIVRELPAAEGRLYREAILEPVGLGAIDDEALRAARARFDSMFAQGPLTRLNMAESVIEYLRDDDVPTHAVLEILAFTVLQDHVAGPDVRYALLAEGDAGARAAIIERQLVALQRLVKRGLGQGSESWPKGCSWN